jgi:urease accessory protein
MTATRPAARATERARGRVRLAVAGRAGGATAIADLAQEGSGRVLFPQVFAPRAPLEAVIVNVGGGIAGGDRFSVSVAAAPDARLSLTTQACEKVYRSDGRAAVIDTRLGVAPGAALHWLPQETILFDGARLTRRLTVDLAGDAECLLVEGVLLGRQAMGESLTAAELKDSWRVRRDGRLLFAEETRISGDLAVLTSPAGLGGRTAFATVVRVGPDAPAALAAARAALENSGAEGGASLAGEVLVCRLVAREGRILRTGLSALVRGLSGGKPPRVWHT